MMEMDHSAVASHCLTCLRPAWPWLFYPPGGWQVLTTASPLLGLHQVELMVDYYLSLNKGRESLNLEAESTSRRGRLLGQRGKPGS